MADFLVRPEGLGELIAALRLVDAGMAGELREGLRAGGQIVQEQARRDFILKQGYGARRRSRSAVDSARYSAERFRTYVRSNTLVQVEQSLRKTNGLHPEWGSLQMTKGLIPARDEKLDEVAARIEFGVGGLLRKHGF